MTKPSPVPRLTDIIEAIELISSEMDGVTPRDFEPDRRKRWLIERGIEIISEASRHLPAELKARHPDIPWPSVATIGNVIRHDYGHVAHSVLWYVVRDDLPPLEKVCREELAAEIAREKEVS
ncbi:protein containing DUF86 [Candidatus Magnetobacterium bavaricum]|uniref:Protein containing DUF86 n=1 Tax=Candidatus Magnetobacterium bavaricum TaxID=29290 RepID=A0A0F3GJL0_9BACT|nr:protein containing DUF86 [Candidatus Magnetobacterium bavaricum]